MILGCFDNPLRLEYSEGRYTRIFWLTVVVCVELGIFLVAGKNPGKIKNICGKVSEENTKNFQDSIQAVLDTKYNYGKIDDFGREDNPAICSVIIPESESDQVPDLSVSTITPNEQSVIIPAFDSDTHKHFCEACQVVQPIRAKHCKECNECVPKYDHHCFWIGKLSRWMRGGTEPSEIRGNARGSDSRLRVDGQLGSVISP